LDAPKILSVLKRLQRWIQDKTGIGENRDALEVLRRRVDAVAALQQQHLPECLSLPWTPNLPAGVSPLVHRADAMFRYPLSVSGGDWARAAQEYFTTGADFADVLRSVLPDPGDVLDYGCGYGRVGRFLPNAFPGAQRWVVDPKAGAMAFQQAQWSATPWNGHHVDLIVAGSVFTHLKPEVAQTELAKLLNALRPGGALVATLHEFQPQTSVHALTEEAALPELEDQLDAQDYVSISFSAADWARLIPQGWTWTLRPERFGGTQQILVLTRGESEA
jgi:SAM-dependent methyltransferase